MLCALEGVLAPVGQIVLVGNPHAADFRQLVTVLHERPRARWTLLVIDSDETRLWLAARAPWLAEMHALDGRATAYVCDHSTCQPPVNNETALRTLLR